MNEQLTFATLEPVTLKASFHTILSKKASEMDEATRRRRWAQWLKIARGTDDDCRKMAEIWTDADGCQGCKHLRGRCWCALQKLPASVNPILSMRHGVLGMACMGMGYEPEQGGSSDADP